MTEQDRKRHEVGVLHYLDPDYDGQGKSASQDETDSMKALVIVLVTAALAALSMLGLIVWLIVR